MGRSFFQKGEAMEGGWRWRYSRFAGVMYGPIPVGFIVAGIALAVYWAVR